MAEIRSRRFEDATAAVDRFGYAWRREPDRLFACESIPRRYDFLALALFRGPLRLAWPNDGA